VPTFRSALGTDGLKASTTPAPFAWGTGERHAIALSSVPAQNPEFLHQLRPAATAFVLTEGKTRTLELKLKKRP
jgi:hypothetical protein